MGEPWFTPFNPSDTPLRGLSSRSSKIEHELFNMLSGNYCRLFGRSVCIATLAAMISLAFGTPAAAQSDSESFLKTLDAALAEAAQQQNAYWFDSLVDVALAARPDLAENILVLRAQRGAAMSPDAPQEIQTADVGPEEAGVVDSRGGWAGDFLLRMELERGDQRELEIDSRLELARDLDSWELKIRGDYERTKIEGIETEDSLYGRFDARKALTERLGIAGFISGENDQFSGYDYRIISGAGPSYKIFDRESLSWQVSAGPALQLVRTTVTDDTDLDLGLAAESLFRWRPVDRITFGADVSAYYSSRSTMLAELYLEAEVLRRLGVRLSQEFDAEFNPPVGASSFNPTTLLSVVFKLGPIEAKEADFDYDALD